MDILILAGGRCDDAMREATGVENRSDLVYGGRTSLEIVMSAVSDFGRCIVTAEKPVEGADYAPAGKSFIGSVTSGLSKVQSESFLLCTSDIPCITKAVIQSYLDACSPDAELNYPIISVDDCDRMFPGMKRTTFKLRDGEYTGGNIALINTEAFRRTVPLLERAYEHRKSPLKIGAIVGPGVLSSLVMAKLIPGSLTISALEKSVTKSLNLKVKGIKTPHAQIGADVDSLDQYLAMKKIVEQSV